MFIGFKRVSIFLIAVILHFMMMNFMAVRASPMPPALIITDGIIHILRYDGFVLDEPDAAWRYLHSNDNSQSIVPTRLFWRYYLNDSTNSQQICPSKKLDINQPLNELPLSTFMSNQCLEAGNYTFCVYLIAQDTDSDPEQIASETYTVAITYPLPDLPRYQVEFDSNGGDEVASQIVVARQSPVKPTVTRSEYIFVDWFLTKIEYDGGGSTLFSDSNSKSYDDCSDFFALAGKSGGIKKLTFKAKWESSPQTNLLTDNTIATDTQDAFDAQAVNSNPISKEISSIEPRNKGKNGIDSLHLKMLMKNILDSKFESQEPKHSQQDNISINPNTGDTTNILMLVFITILSLVCAVAATYMETSL